MNKVMYLIGNAHLDPVWLWDWREGYAENNATMKSMLDRLDEFDFLQFTSSSSVFYEWIEESNPSMFESIKKRVHEGRWSLCGGWYIQPDCNLPSGESFARHTLYAQNYFFSKFGCISTVGYCVDSFGHCGTLPQILQKSRMTAYVFMRPGRHEKNIHENLFIWESPDGSQVTAYRIPFNYNAHFGVEKQIDDCMSEFVGDFPGIMVFYGVGNHGGGPTIENIKSILQKKQEYPDIQFKFSTPPEFFRDVKNAGLSLPIIKEDLQHHASGCYSVHSEIKRLNRKAENSILRAEKVSVIGNHLLEIPYAIDEFDKAWKNILFNQFHDILAGTCLRTAYEDARDSYGLAKTIASALENRTIQALSWNVDIPYIEKSIPIFIFNPHGWKTCLPIEIEGGHHRNMEFPKNPVLYDFNNNIVDFQIIEAAVHCRNRQRIVFNATLPALGYGVYTLCEGGSEYNGNNESLANSLSMENDFLKVEFSKTSGGICQILEKATNTILLEEDACIGTIVNDTSDTWGHATITYNEIIGFFKVERIEKLEFGPVRERIRTYSVYQSCYMIQDFFLYSGVNYITVKTKIFWAEQLKALRLDFPLKIKNPTVTYEVPFGSIDKPANGEEEPMQNWVDLHDGEGRGLGVATDCKYSSAAFNSTLSILVLRSPVYSHHVPTKLELPIDRYNFIDQGEQFFEYRIIPHSTNSNRVTLFTSGFEVNQNPIILFGTYHQGVLPKSKGFYWNSEGSIVLSSLKQSNIGSGYVARFQETLGKSCSPSIRFFEGNTFTVDFSKFEIKTIRIDKDGNYIEELDFLEWPIGR